MNWVQICFFKDSRKKVLNLTENSKNLSRNLSFLKSFRDMYVFRKITIA